MSRLTAQALLLAAVLPAMADFYSTLPGWGLPLPTTAPETLPIAAIQQAAAPLHTEPGASLRKDAFSGLFRPVVATALLGHFVWRALPGAVDATVNALLPSPAAGTATAGRFGRTLANAWVSLTTRPAIPYMVGALSVDGQGTALVIRPVGAATGGGVFPICASFESDDGGARRACGFIAASGGILPLAGAANNPWVTASMPTPLGPRIALSPAVLARGLHVARSMPDDDRTWLVEDIEVTLHTRLIDPADSVAALVAIEFAGEHRPQPTRATAG